MSAEFTNFKRAPLEPPVPMLVAYRHPSIHGLAGVFKRLIDVAFALVGLTLCLPVMLVIGLLVKLDSPGPIVFRQQRVGLNGQVFWMYKFRTMGTDAEARHQELLAYNEMTDGVIFKMSNDPRVTRVGRLLRRTSLDELPQLYNVLKGDMSLIGPRPLPTYETAKHQAHQLRRLTVLPGCTGLWQVSGRSDLDSFEKMVDLDLRYIEEWSFLLDLRILLRTVSVVLRARGSY